MNASFIVDIFNSVQI